MAELGNLHVQDDIFAGGLAASPGTTFGVGGNKIKGTVTATGGLCVGDTVATFPGPLATVMFSKPSETDVVAQIGAGSIKPVLMVSGQKGIPNPGDVTIGLPYPAGFTAITGLAPFSIVCGSSINMTSPNYSLISAAREEVGASTDIGAKHFTGVQCEVSAIENLSVQHEAAPMVNSAVDIAVDFITATGSSLNATTKIAKSALALAGKGFDIPHPTKEDHRLRYICLEGPEVGAYIRGTLVGEDEIELPDYWRELCKLDTITVNLTPVGGYQKLFVKGIDGTTIVVGEDDGKDIFCDYTVFAERRTHDKLQVEYKGLTPADYPGDNTEYALGGWDYAEHKGEPKSSDL